jgi:ribonucleoside-triphosphate reductase
MKAAALGGNVARHPAMPARVVMSERVTSAEACKQLVKRALERFGLPYVTVTPTFSICPKHGYLAGEHKFCPKCDEILLAKKRRAVA